MSRRSSPLAPTEPASPPAAALPPTEASRIAASIKELLVTGQREEARERFTALVDLLHRRALRIAYHYLRDADDAAEATQDAFLKVFLHLTSYSEARPFESWFTRILINGCLDRQKSRTRRLKWTIPMADTAPRQVVDPPSPAPTPEARLLTRSFAGALGAALAQLPARQREVFILRYVDDQSSADVSEALGLTEATVRVHLFRALRRLRGLLER